MHNLWQSGVLPMSTLCRAEYTAMIELHYAPTPNGRKVAILLEEAQLPYRLVPVDISSGEQFKAGFLAISPNNRIPAMVDPDGPGGEPLSLFESAAILLYLAEKAGRFLPPSGSAGYHCVCQWLFWQMANQGPVFGHLNHFLNYAEGLGASATADGDVAYARTRFSQEADRLLAVMDRRLGEAEYLAGDDYSIADMAAFPWLLTRRAVGIDLAPFTQLSRWYEALKTRPGVRAGIDAGTAEFSNISTLPGEFTKEQKRALFGQDSSVYKR